MKDVSGGREHFYIVLCEFGNPPDELLMVNYTSIPYDKTCILEPADADFIKVQSYVFYRHCLRIAKTGVLERIQKRYTTKGNSGYKGEFRETVFRRIYEGALIAGATRRDYKDILRQNNPF